MTTQTIEVEGLPEGIIAHSVKVVDLDSGDSEQLVYNARVIAKRVRPRRIVLEETGEVNFLSKGEWFESCEGNFIQWNSPNISKTAHMIWKQVKETDIPLTNAEPKLSLNVAECKSIIYAPIELHVKLEKFIKENS